MIFEIPIDHFPTLCQSKSLEESTSQQQRKIGSVTQALARSAFCLSTISIGETQPVPIFDQENSSVRSSRASSIHKPLDKRDLFRRTNSAPQLLKKHTNSPSPKKKFTRADSHSSSVISLSATLLKRFRHLTVE